MARIKFENITFRYQDNVILNNFSLEVDDGQIMCLVGPSGCGKTTLIRCLLGFNKPESGEIYVGNRCVFSKEKRINVAPERRGIGVVFQDYAVWPHLTVWENVCYPLKKKKLSKDEIKERAKYALNQVRMSQYADYLPSQLSGGQQQRVAIARALVSSDEVIVMDEPITNLDAKLREEMLQEIREIQKNIGTTIFYITHDQEASLQLCDYMAIMDYDGNLVQIGIDEDIVLHPKSRFVFEFIGVSNFFTLIKKGEKWYFEHNTNYECDFKVPEEFKNLKRVDVGIRPDDIQFDHTSKLKASVTRAVFLGSEYDYFVDFSGKEVRIQKNSFTEGKDGKIEKEGDVIGLKFMNPKFYKAKEV